MKFKHLRRACFGLIFLSAALFAATCDKSGNTDVSAPSAGPGGGTVTSVAMTEPNVIVITGDSKLDGYPFVLSNPFRIGVDVKDASIDQALPKPMGGSGAVTRVEVVSRNELDPPVVRVVAHLNQNATYKLDGKGKELVLTIDPKGGTEESIAAADDNLIPYEETKDELERILTGAPPPTYPDMPESYYTAPSSSPSGYSAPSSSGAMLPSMPSPNSDGSASVVGDVFYRTITDGIQIMVLTNGDARNFVDFDVLRPPRIVVDLFGSSSVADKRTFPVNFRGVNRVRVGQHYDKTRVVIDLRGKLKAYDVNKTSSGIVVTILEDDYIPGGLKSREHMTTSGESLRSIAQKYYGTPEAWVRVMSANRHVFTKRELEEIRRSEGALPVGAGIRMKIPMR